MKIIPLGVGGAFTDRFYHTNYLVELPGLCLLIDTGTTLRYSLQAAGYIAKDISAIAITHFHSDHVGGIEELAQRCRYLYQHKPTLYAMPDQLPLFAGLFALHGSTPDSYFTVKTTIGRPIALETNQGSYQLEYYSTLGLHAKVTSSYMIGIRRLEGEKSSCILFTGDIGPIEKSMLGTLVSDPQTIAVFHDCHTGQTPVPAHANLAQMEEFYPVEVRSKIYAIHYGDDITNYAQQITKARFQIAQQGMEYQLADGKEKLEIRS